MNRTLKSCGWIAALALSAGATPCACLGAGAGEAAFAGKNYYPSPDRPFGWRGDGSGAFPGAEPVTEWGDGAPVMGSLRKPEWGETGWAYPLETDQKGGRPKKGWVLADRNPKNIVWKVRMPSHSDTQPIVVGDRVVTTADPYSLICMDVNDGRILWVRDAPPFELIGLPAAEADALQVFCDRAFALVATYRDMIGNYSRLPNSIGPLARKRILHNMAYARGVLDAAWEGPRLGRVHAARVDLATIVSRVEQLLDGEGGGSLPRTMQHMGAEFIKGINETYGFHPIGHWTQWTGWTFPTPVSDGEYVYSSMGQGQIVCYALNGDLKWRVHVPARFGVGNPLITWGGNMGTEHCPSPLLAGDVLVVTRSAAGNADTGILGLNKHTGRKLWQVDPPVSRIKVSTPAVVRLKAPNGNRVFALVLGNNHVLKATTGEVVCRLQEGRRMGNMPGGGSASVVVTGNRIVKDTHQGEIGCWSFTADNDGSINAKEEWRAKVGVGSHTPVAYGGHLYTCGGDGFVTRIADGKVIAGRNKDGVTFPFGHGYASSIVAGRHLINYFSPPWGHRRFVHYPVQSQAIEIVEPGRGKPGRINLFDGDPAPAMPRLEKHIPGYKGDLWSCDGATPLQFGFGSLSACGNRLFVRSCAYMYCIGDPSVPYNWDPRTRPSAITESLGAPYRPETAKDAVAWLSSPYRWNREQGRNAILALPEAGRAAVLNEIGAIAAGKPRNAACEALRTLRDLGKEAAGAAPRVLNSARAALAEDDFIRFRLCREALLAAAPERDAVLVPLLKESLTGGDAKTAGAACRAARLLKDRAEPLAPHLVPLLRSSDTNTVVHAAFALAELRPAGEQAAAALKTLLEAPSPRVVEAGLHGLIAQDLDARTLLACMLPLCRHDNILVRHGAADAMASLKELPPELAADCAGALKGKDPRVASAAARALAKGDSAARRLLTQTCIDLLTEKDAAVVASVLRAIPAVCDKMEDAVLRIRAVETLIATFPSRDPRIKRLVCIALGAFGPDAHLAAKLLKQETNGKHCPEEAKAALAIIAPDASTDIESDIDLGLDF